MRGIKITFVLVVAIQLTGCAFGQRVDYRQAVPVISISTESEISVAVIDERPYVASRSKNPNYVGTFRALYYNPFNVTTVSGAPLANDLQAAILTGMERSGVNVHRHVAESHTAARTGQRLLLIRVGEWKSDTYMRTRFDYDISATVRNDQGDVLGSSSAKWSGPINHFLHAGGDALRAVIGDEKVSAALSGAALFAPESRAAPVRLSKSDYDNCMARVMRISDKGLRLQAMPACDEAL